MLNVPYYRQMTDYTCGPAALQMVFAYFKKRESQKKLTRFLHTTSTEGTGADAIVHLSRTRGFYAYARDNSTLKIMKKFIAKGMPVIINFVEPIDEEFHFAVVIGFRNRTIVLNDPANGKGYTIPEKEFLKRWYGGEKKHRRWMLAISDAKIVAR